MRSLRERELDAQLAANRSEQEQDREIVADLQSEVGSTEHELEWVAARQKQNSRDRRYWPNHEAYRKPSPPEHTPIVEAPVRSDPPHSSNR